MVLVYSLIEQNDQYDISKCHEKKQNLLFNRLRYIFPGCLYFLGVCISWCSCWIFSFRYSICMLNAVILSKYIKVCIEEEESSLSNETVRFLTYLWRKIFCLKSMLNRNLATYRVLKKSGSIFKTKKQNFNRFNFLFPTCQSKHVSIF